MYTSWQSCLFSTYCSLMSHTAGDKTSLADPAGCAAMRLCITSISETVVTACTSVHSIHQLGSHAM